MTLPSYAPSYVSSPTPPISISRVAIHSSATISRLLLLKIVLTTAHLVLSPHQAPNAYHPTMHSRPPRHRYNSLDKSLATPTNYAFLLLLSHTSGLSLLTTTHRQNQSTALSAIFHTHFKQLPVFNVQLCDNDPRSLTPRIFWPSVVLQTKFSVVNQPSAKFSSVTTTPQKQNPLLHARAPRHR